MSDILAQNIKLTDNALSVEAMLSEELFHKERMTEVAADALGVLPFKPSQPLFNQVQQQELYFYGTQEWCDYHWVRDHFEMFRFVCRMDDMVLIVMRPELLLEGQPQPGYYLTLPADKARGGCPVAAESEAGAAA